jgi:LPXTG-motif cell wall-anchored protein
MRGLHHRLVSLCVMIAGLLVVSAGQAGAEARVRLTPEGFDPPTVHVPLGGAVTWVNDMASARTIAGEGAVWDSGPLQPGESFTLTPREAGRLEYGTADGAHVGVLLVGAEAPPRGDGAATAQRSYDGGAVAAPVEALAETGASTVALVLAGLALVGAGVVLLARAGAP